VNTPADLRFAPSHEWLRLAGSDATVGISDHAQEELTDIVYVELPQVGAEVSAGDQVCVVESVKAASDIYAPVHGKVTAVNEALQSNPALINTDPYGEGWIFRLQVNDPAEAEKLLSSTDYDAQAGGPS
jgi:glycine cleavage system H protein